MSRKTLLGVLYVGAAAAIGLYLSRGPWLAYADQKHKADAATKEMQKAEREKTDLLKQEAQIDSPVGRDTAARKAGYLGKNEEPVHTDR
jgi:hypothetical protein